MLSRYDDCHTLEDCNQEIAELERLEAGLHATMAICLVLAVVCLIAARLLKKRIRHLERRGEAQW